MLNIRSLRKNLDIFVAKFLEPDIQVIVLTETWIYSYEETLYCIPGFRGFFKSNDSYRAGGVAVYVRESLAACELEISAESCDAVLCEIVWRGVKWNLVAIYRSPTDDVSNPQAFVRTDIDCVLRRLDPEAECLILGDMNLCLLHPGGVTLEYLESLSSSGFLCLNDSSPTRVHEDTSTIIDHAFG